MRSDGAVLEYRQAYWLGKIRECSTSGLSIRGYCKQASLNEKSYYFWRRKLRELGAVTAEELATPKELPMSATFAQKSVIPSGWASCSQVTLSSPGASGIDVEISGCHLTVTPGTDMSLLLKVCSTLKTLC